MAQEAFSPDILRARAVAGSRSVIILCAKVVEASCDFPIGQVTSMFCFSSSKYFVGRSELIVEMP